MANLQKKTEWRIYGRRADFNGLSARFSVSPVLIRLMVNRGVAPEEMGQYLHGTLRDLPAPALLKDLEKAAELLIARRNAGGKVRVIGDYDIDGICASCILLIGLRRIGLDTDYDIPDRVKDGYGLNERLVTDAADAGRDTLITCDNGIAAVSEIRKAKELGLTVIVTDHHEVGHGDDGGELLPPADAVVDPKREGCGYPTKSICGAVVAWKLVQRLFQLEGVPRETWEEMLPFAAIATVGDVMPLQGENRIIVREGLIAMKDCRITGLRALLESCGLNPERLTAYSIGFVIGPCLNAGGRLESARVGLDLLMERDEARARKLAEHLKDLNDERKDMTARSTEEALRQAEEQESTKVLVVYVPECHESVAGIVAGRLREHCYRPSIVLTDSADPGLLKGSGRSIEAYHMFRGLEEVKDLLVRFGGHPMAAGMTLRREDLPEFRRRLNANADLTEEELTERVWIDAPVPFGYLSEAFVKELSLLAPFGQGNESPVFAQKNVRILSARAAGRNRNVVRLRLLGEDRARIDGILFGDADSFFAEKGNRDLFSILYYPEINEYMGTRSLQVVIRGWKFQ